MRKENSIKNFITTFFPYIVVTILGFIRIRVYLYGLGEDIASLNQVFNNIFAYLAIAESGIGLFIGQKYYKLLLDEDYKQINKCYKASKIFFNFLGLFVIVLGVIISFWLDKIAKNSLNLHYMQLVFFLFLVKSSIDFFMYPPRMVLNSDQKMYKINLLINITKVVEFISEILLIKMDYDFVVVLIPTILIRLIFNIFINKKIFKIYPWLNSKEKFDFKELKGSKNIIYQKLSGLIYDNTDILIISYFLNPTLVIIYSSYNYITKYLNDISYMMISSIQPSLGNALYAENKKESYRIFKQINILFYFIASLCTVLLVILINPFIEIWVGPKYLLNDMGRYFFGLILFINISKRTMLVMKDNLGLFKETKYVIILEAILNLSISILLVKKFDINGVLIGTIVSTTLTTFWYIPKYIYNNFFKRKAYSYFIKYLICLLNSSIITYLIEYFIKIKIDNIFEWLLYAIIIGLTLVLIMTLEFYFLFPEFKEIYINLKGMFIHRYKRK